MARPRRGPQEAAATGSSTGSSAVFLCWERSCADGRLSSLGSTLARLLVVAGSVQSDVSALRRACESLRYELAGPTTQYRGSTSAPRVEVELPRASLVGVRRLDAPRC